MALLAKLRPMGPWRAGPDSGERSRASAMLHSDALYSALTHAMAQLGMLEPWIEATAANPQGSAVRLSSCFPFVEQLLFVLPPKPFWPPAASLRVRWKSAKYVPTSMVSLLLNGRSIREDDWSVDGPSECLLPIYRGQPVASPYRPALRSASAVDRLGEGVEAHRTACIEFHRNAGVWMAFDFVDHAARQRWTPALQGALRLLADTGLGGERSRGWGRFEQPEFVEGPLAKLLFGKHAQAVPQASDTYWLLSLFSPAESDTVDWTQGSYSVAIRGGRVESSAGWGAVKKTSRVIAEGSVLVAAGPLTGMAHDVSPEGFAHPVYRAGFALALPVIARKPEPVVVEESEGPEENAVMSFEPETPLSEPPSVDPEPPIEEVPPVTPEPIPEQPETPIGEPPTEDPGLSATQREPNPSDPETPVSEPPSEEPDPPIEEVPPVTPEPIPEQSETPIGEPPPEDPDLLAAATETREPQNTQEKEESAG